MASLAAAQAAKDSLRQKLHGQPWFRGIGFTQLKCMGPDPYQLQVMIDTMASAPLVPRSWLGVPVSITVVGTIRALGDTGITAQDFGNVAGGFMVFAATFFVGKIVVSSIIEARKEHFDAKGQPPAAVKSKETTGDGLVKLLGIGLTVYQITNSAPEIVSQVQKLLK
jgi:hypothetical protein